MSARIVAKTHIDLLVRAGLEYERGQRGLAWWRVDEDGGFIGWRTLRRHVTGDDGDDVWGPDAVGQLLVMENVASVAYRYPDDDVSAGELPSDGGTYYFDPYVYTDPRYELMAGEVFKAIDYLDYQSCEHPRWRQSEAYAFLHSLRWVCCTRVPGYDKSPWGWQESKVTAWAS